MNSIFASVIRGLNTAVQDLQIYPADTFPTIHPIHWLTSHYLPPFMKEVPHVYSS